MVAVLCDLVEFMNIIEMAQECQLIGMRPHLDGIYQAALEQFAELIVKETMQVVANQLPSNQYLDVARAVIEHFGVKE